MESHLLQMRGLKLLAALRKNSCILSHLLQMRGLKPKKRVKLPPLISVASFTDAWIETTRSVRHWNKA